MLLVLLNNFWVFKYALSFLVLLGRFISSFILPTQHFTAIATININNSVEANQEMPIFFWPRDNIDYMGKQKGSVVSSLVIKFMTIICGKAFVGVKIIIPKYLRLSLRICFNISLFSFNFFSCLIRTIL